MATIGTKEASERLGITQSTIAKLCREGKIKGAEQDAKGSPWHIPENTIEEMLKKKQLTYGGNHYETINL